MKKIVLRDKTGKELRKAYKLDGDEYILLPSKEECPELYLLDGFFANNPVDVEIVNDDKEAIDSKEIEEVIVEAVIETENQTSNDINKEQPETKRNTKKEEKKDTNKNVSKASLFETY